MRNDIIVDTLTRSDIVELVECGGMILQVFEGFFCHNLDYNPYTELVTDVFEKKGLFKAQRNRFVSNPS